MSIITYRECDKCHEKITNMVHSRKLTVESIGLGTSSRVEADLCPDCAVVLDGILA